MVSRYIRTTHSARERVVAKDRMILGRATLIMLLSMVERKIPVAMRRKIDRRDEDVIFSINGALAVAGQKKSGPQKGPALTTSEKNFFSDNT
jgi:hypothetical protein